MNVGDLKPDLEISLSARDRGELFHIEDATSVRVIGMRGNTVVFDHEATSYVTRGRYAIVIMEFVSGDTSTVGRVDVKVVITWPGNKAQTICTTNDLLIGAC